MGRTEMKILIGLHRNVNALDKKTSKIAAEYNLTFSQFMVLEALICPDYCSTAREI